MLSGKVKWFDPRQAFGYIIPDEGGPEVFVHSTVVESNGSCPLTEGQPVEYLVEMTAKGPRAAWARPITAAPSKMDD